MRTGITLSGGSSDEPIGVQVFELDADKGGVQTLPADTTTVGVTAGSGSADEVVRVDPLVEEYRSRPTLTPSRRELTVSSISAGLYLAAAVALMAFSRGSLGDLATGPGMLFLLCYAVTSRIEFEIGTGSAVPTQLVLVPMLFVLPAGDVPMTVLLAYALSATFDVASGALRPERIPVVLSTCWHALGPAVVLAMWGSGRPDWDQAGIYALALGSQFALDLVSSVIRESAGFGVPARSVATFLCWVFLVDALLAPPALTATFTIVDKPVALLGLMPLAVLLWVFARDRHTHIDQTLALSQAIDGANEQARHDGLTGAFNRLGWDEACAALHQASEGTWKPVSVLVVDVDHLKDANDRHGHEFGDSVIRATARALAGGIRTGDILARIGGDEFAILLPGTGEGECSQIAGRLQRMIAASKVGSMTLSASIGSATCRADHLDEGFRVADSRMYRTKRAKHEASVSGD
jgi:diguanylate cyclase (GGDEF)-like protein